VDRTSTLAGMVVLAVPAVAAAHPAGLSTFDARTDARDIAVAFQIDATSAVDLIGRAGVPTMAVEVADAGHKAAVPEYASIVLGYLDARFTIANGDTVCRRGEPLRLEYVAATDKIGLDLRYHCGGTLTELRLSSTLFHDETTPHQVIGTVRHAALLERTFFTRGETMARIDLRNVPLPPEGGIGSRQFRMATPPARGARPAAAAAAVPVPAPAPAPVPAGAIPATAAATPTTAPTRPRAALAVASVVCMMVLVWLVRRRAA
jgi:hypothetical protein